MGSEKEEAEEGEEEEEEEGEGGKVKEDELTTPEKQQHPLLLRRRLKSLSLSSPAEAPSHGADPATFDDAKASSAPGTPYGSRGHADSPDLDFLGALEEEEEERAASPGVGGGGGGGGAGGTLARRRAFAAASSASTPAPANDDDDAHETALGAERSEETIWDRLRGPHASEANAASAEAVAEGLTSPEAREREEAEVATRLGGGTGKAL